MIATDGRYCITVGDVGVLMQREKDKLISYSINLNPALIQVLDDIASIHPRGDCRTINPDQNSPHIFTKRSLRSLSVKEVENLLSSDMFTVFQEAWHKDWFHGMDGRVLSNIVNESMVSKIWKDETLGSAYATELLSVLHDLRSEGVLVKNPLEVLSVEEVEALLRGPIFRGLRIEYSLIKGVDGSGLSECLNLADDWYGWVDLCPHRDFIERLRDVQAGRASHSPCHIPLLSLSHEEVKRLFEGEEFQRFSIVLGNDWYDGLDGYRLYETVISPEFMKEHRNFPLYKSLTKSLADIIIRYHVSGLPEDKVRPLGGWNAPPLSGDDLMEASHPVEVRRVESDQVHDGAQGMEVVPGQGDGDGGVDDGQGGSDRGVGEEQDDVESKQDHRENAATPMAKLQVKSQSGNEILSTLMRDDKYGKDFIGTSVLAEALADSIYEGDNLPLVIGLFAPWGAGKSFILEKVETHMKYRILTRNIEELKDILKDYPLSKEALFELDRLKNSDPNQLERIFSWCEVYGGPEPADITFENDIYKVINRNLAHLKPAHRSNIIFPQGKERYRRNLVSALWLYNVAKKKLARVKKKEETVGDKDFHFLFFNAWLYCGSDNLWAGLVKALHKAVEERYGPSYAFAKYRAMLVLVVFTLIVSVGLMVGCVAFYIRINDEFQNLSSATLIIHSAGLILGSVLSLGTGSYAAYTYLITPLSSSEEIEMTCSKTEVKKKLGFMAAVKQELNDIGDTLRDPASCVPNMWTYLCSWLHLTGWVPISHLFSSNARPCNLVIFIDDLDRCPPEKIVQVLQALVLLAETSPFVFFLAVDPRIIVAAVESQDEVYSSAGVNGYEFLDKIIQIPFTIPMMCDSEKMNLARGYLDPSPSSKVPRESMVMWLDSRRVKDGNRCYTKHGDRKYVVTSADGKSNRYFRYFEGLAILEDIRSAKTIFTVHSNQPVDQADDNPEDLSRVESNNHNSWDYFRCNGGPLGRELDTEWKCAVGAVDKAPKVTCRIVVVYGADHPVWEVIREMIVYNRVLSYDEIKEVESYLSERWKVELMKVPDNQPRLDAKRLDFLKSFYAETKPYGVEGRLALLDQNQFITSDSFDNIEAFTLRKVTAALSRQTVPELVAASRGWKVAVEECLLADRPVDETNR
eukprot:gene1726-2026_t